MAMAGSFSMQCISPAVNTGLSVCLQRKVQGRGNLRIGTPSKPAPAVSVVRCSAGTAEALRPAITLSERALNHLVRLRDQQGNSELCLRVGVKAGGCSGMSYVMDFEKRENFQPEDSVIEENGFTMVCDPKSLLYLYGLELDYSDALIGGGFKFANPNASNACGCGKSFAA